MRYETLQKWLLIVLLLTSAVALVGWAFQDRWLEAGWAWLVGAVAAFNLIPFIRDA